MANQRASRDCFSRQGVCCVCVWGCLLPTTAGCAVGRCVKQTVALEMLEENEDEEAGIEGTTVNCKLVQHVSAAFVRLYQIIYSIHFQGGSVHEGSNIPLYLFNTSLQCKPLAWPCVWQARGVLQRRLAKLQHCDSPRAQLGFQARRLMRTYGPTISKKDRV